MPTPREGAAVPCPSRRLGPLCTGHATGSTLVAMSARVAAQEIQIEMKGVEAAAARSSHVGLAEPTREPRSEIDRGVMDNGERTSLLLVSVPSRF